MNNECVHTEGDPKYASLLVRIDPEGREYELRVCVVVYIVEL